MKQFRPFLLLLLAVYVAGCASRRPDAAAQAPDGAAMQPGALTVQAPPVHSLIGHREQLGLSSEQITALDSIGVWLQRANAPAIAELRGVMGGGRGMGPLRPGAGRANEEALPIIERIGENNRAAVQGVREVLSDEQQTRVCEILASRPGGGQAMRSAGGGGAGGGGGGRRVIRQPGGGAQGGVASRSAWEWCSPTPEAEPQGTSEIRRDG